MDPRHFSMIAFGGAGPVHAFGVADLINAPKLIVPVGAGVTSAVGFLLSPIAKENIKSHIVNLEELEWMEVNRFLAAMEENGKQFLLDSEEKVENIKVSRVVEMRYEGQGHEITIKLPNGILNEMSVEEITKRFHKEYKFRYNRSIDNVAIQMVTWRVLVEGLIPKLEVKQSDFDDDSTDPSKGTRKVYFQSTGYLDCPVYNRYKMTTGFNENGPMIIEEKESTTVVGLNSKVSIDAHKNIIIDFQ